MTGNSTLIWATWTANRKCCGITDPGHLACKILCIKRPVYEQVHGPRQDSLPEREQFQKPQSGKSAG